MKKSTIIFLLIFFVTLTFRAWQMASFDIYADLALNSFRSLGWLDFLGGSQTTPIQWFGQIPFWANLSFHDMPVAVPFIQHLFFVLFGDSTTVARLPFLMADLLTTFLIFLLLKRYKDETTALLAALIFAVSSFATWGSLAGYLEVVESVFILLSLFFFLAFVSGDRGPYSWAIFTGLALDSKYTAIFILPATFGYLAFWGKNIWSRARVKKQLFCSLVIFIIIISPTIIYNIKVYQTRGHFDAALSSMVGMHPVDFGVIAGRSVETNVESNITAIVRTLSEINSLPFLVLFVLSLIYLGMKVFRRRADVFDKVIGLYLLAMLALFLGSGIVSNRFLLILVPMMAVVSAMFIVAAFSYTTQQSNRVLKIILVVVLVSALLTEIVYSLNTNVFSSVIVPGRYLYSPSRFYSYGWNELDNYIKNKLVIGTLDFKGISTVTDITALGEEDIRGKNVLIYDERLNWFDVSWYLQRYLVYYKYPLFKSSLITDNRNVEKDFFSQLESLGARHIYLIVGVSVNVMDPIKSKDLKVVKSLVEYVRRLERSKVPTILISDYRDLPAFKIYQIK